MVQQYLVSPHHTRLVHHHKWLRLLHPQAALHIDRCLLPILTVSKLLVGTLCNDMHADMQLSKSGTFRMSVALISLLWVSAPHLHPRQEKKRLRLFGVNLHPSQHLLINT